MNLTDIITPERSWNQSTHAISLTWSSEIARLAVVLEVKMAVTLEGIATGGRLLKYRKCSTSWPGHKRVRCPSRWTLMELYAFPKPPFLHISGSISLAPCFRLGTSPSQFFFSFFPEKESRTVCHLEYGGMVFWFWGFFSVLFLVFVFTYLVPMKQLFLKALRMVRYRDT